MARNSATFAKRQREAERQQKRRQKMRRREERRTERAQTDTDPEVEDPDLAGIVAGPQPHPYMDDDELKEPLALSPTGGVDPTL